MTQSPAKPEPHLDLSYAIEDDIPPGEPNRDSRFVFERMHKLITDEATEGEVGLALDVGCGFGQQMDLLRERGWEAVGLDASFDLARYSAQRFRPQAPAVCAIAEALPFADASFDSIVCQGSLDHFARPKTFVREVARVLKPDGRAVIALANYDSLSARFGSRVYWLKRRFGVPVFEGRNYWQIPRNHTFRGSYRVLLSLCEQDLELVECRGISLLWLFHNWTRLMEALPSPIARTAMSALDRIAYVRPSIADIIVSVWRPKPPWP
jgi:SAM-dependent methyltransferase